MLSHYYKDLVFPRDLYDIETRFVGPSERHLEVFVVITVVIRYELSKYEDTKKVLALSLHISLNPWCGSFVLLNLSDFSPFCKYYEKTFQINKIKTYSHFRLMNRIPPLKEATDFYIQRLRSENLLLSNHFHLSEALTNFSIFKGLRSLTEIIHPTLPYTIVNDLDTLNSYDSGGDYDSAYGSDYDPDYYDTHPYDAL